MSLRVDGRKADELRPVTIRRRFTKNAPGSVLVKSGQTTVLCTASIEQGVPFFLEGQGRGWVTAEYAMLPGSTSSRKSRDRAGKVDGRTTEIQRLIGRSLRAVVDMEALGEHTVWVDCDVLEADGGTRTASITGAWVALVDAVKSIKTIGKSSAPVIRQCVAATSVGSSGGKLLLDLNYIEDSSADVDMNVVMTNRDEFIEVQGTAEGRTFSKKQLDDQLQLAQQGIHQLMLCQRKALGRAWPLD